MDQAVSVLNLSAPDYIKLDVDGIEHFILKGGIQTLKGVKSIILEVNDDYFQQANACKEILLSAGFYLKHKKQSELNKGTEFRHTFNQIWNRKDTI